MNLMHDIPMCY